ncbi:MAG: hypothetical protein IT359_12585 [Gemmatimonadaceae bacterium]|nr:hypothetical protein [Gemmatimonadaceae bacterium]
MFIELVDSLRCPSPHEQTWLVASVTRLEGRDIVDGLLGCPVCRRQFTIRDGEVDFTDGAEGRESDADAAAREGRDAPREGGDEETLLRLRALLALGDGGGVVLLGGNCAAWAFALEDEAQVLPLLLNAPRHGVARGRYASALRTQAVLPLAPGTLRAAWLDSATASGAMLDSVVEALRARGRLVAPASVPVPAGVRELARDAYVWVAERAEATPGVPVPLRRR